MSTQHLPQGHADQGCITVAPNGGAMSSGHPTIGDMWMTGTVSAQHLTAGATNNDQGCAHSAPDRGGHSGISGV